MSTGFLIGLERPDGSVLAIAGHFDGRPKDTGKPLIENFGTYSKVAKLVDLGNIDSIDSVVAGRCVEPSGRPQELKDAAAFWKCEHLGPRYWYLFRHPGSWLVATRNGDPLPVWTVLGIQPKRDHKHTRLEDICTTAMGAFALHSKEDRMGALSFLCARYGLDPEEILR